MGPKAVTHKYDVQVNVDIGAAGIRVTGLNDKASNLEVKRGSLGRNLTTGEGLSGWHEIGQ